MLPEPAAEDWSFPRAVAGVEVLVRYAAAQGVAPARILTGTGLGVDDLASGEREVTAAQELRVVRAVRRELGEVGLEVGATYRAATFGAFGYAMQAGRTVLDAMTTGLRFIDLSFAFAIPRATVEGDRVLVDLEGSALPGDVRRFLVERDAEAVRRVLDALVPGGVGARLELAVGRARIEFGADQLDRPLPDRSAEALATAEAVCRDVVDRRRARSGFAADVRVLVTQRLRDGAPMGEVADALGCGERTLRRRLAGEGTTYRELLDEVRSSMAAALTARPSTLPTADLAAHLGYGSAAALAHARARWTPDRPGCSLDDPPPRAVHLPATASTSPLPTFRT